MVYVQDGDSVVLCCERSKKFTVRLLDIDAPERYQPYAKQSKAFLKNLLDGQKLKLLGDKHDRYGRRLAVIEVDGVSINEKMVSSGAAWVWKYSKNPRMRSLQQEAKERKLGLWALPEEQRQDPSDWRKAHPRK
ncbi:thermonuclease family protein [Kangiella japonica]|uniref:Thermonuclease family protein n=1 Tax=Kangiella japonica TaxID=647384 RepID=A0ABN0T1L4_9GAMM